MNNYPILLQQLLNNLYNQQAQQPQLTPQQVLTMYMNNYLAYDNPKVQDRFNEFKRLDPTLEDKNLNYIPTTEQINKEMRRPFISTLDLMEAQRIRDNYNKITGQNL